MDCETISIGREELDTWATRTAVLRVDDELLALGGLGVSGLRINILVDGRRAYPSEKTGKL